MTKKIFLFALMTCLAGSLAFAGDGLQSGSYPAGTPPASTADSSGNAASAGETPRPTTKEKKDKKDKKKKGHDAKPAPSKEEQEFDHMLLGIHG